MLGVDCVYMKGHTSHFTLIRLQLQVELLSHTILNLAELGLSCADLHKKMNTVVILSSYVCCPFFVCHHLTGVKLKVAYSSGLGFLQALCTQVSGHTQCLVRW